MVKEIFIFIFLIFFYVWLEFHINAQVHVTTPQSVIRIMHYSHTPRHIPATAVATRTLAKGVHRGDL